jgi:signal transduction histidine kinase
MSGGKPSANPSLVRRLAVRLGVIGLLSGALAYGFLFVEFSTILHGLKDGTLYGEAEYLAHTIALDPTGPPRLALPPAAAALYGDGSRRYRITMDGRTVAQSPRPPAPLHDLRLSRPGRAMIGFEDLVGVYERPLDPSGRHVFGAIVEEEIAGRPMRIQVERETEHFSLLAETLLDEFFDDGGWLGLPFLVLVGLASVATVAQTLRPLRRLSRQAAAIGPANPASRLTTEAVPKEVLPLVRAVNGAVERLEQAFEAQRTFTADAAHELRTPLAILRLRLDALPPSDLRQSLERDAAVMSRLVDQLLQGARLETVTLPPDAQADLVAVARDVAESLAPAAVARGVDLELAATEPAVVVRGDPGALYDAARNLVENAIAHSPTTGRVVIAVTADTPRGDRTLAVADQGPGIAAADRPHLFQRFWQGREASGGAGLGLSIVHRVAVLHDAAVEVTETPGGGATFTLRFPPSR